MRLINIDGTLINLENVTHAKMSGESPTLYIVFDSLNEFEYNEIEFKGDNAKRAYDWLVSGCVETFTDETGQDNLDHYVREVKGKWGVFNRHNPDQVIREHPFKGDAIAHAGDLNNGIDKYSETEYKRLHGKEPEYTIADDEYLDGWNSHYSTLTEYISVAKEYSARKWKAVYIYKEALKYPVDEETIVAICFRGKVFLPKEDSQ